MERPVGHRAWLRTLLVAPFNMRRRFIEMIERETQHRSAGRDARIVSKMNQLENIEIATALVTASQAGVEIDSIVRGFCCLRPGVPGYTENVRVRSIIGRFLEHSRIFHFAHGQRDPELGEFYVGFAYWMYHNLSRRVEAAAPIMDPAARHQLWLILRTCLEDRRHAWVFKPDGTYVQCHPDERDSEAARVGTHAWLMQLTRERATARASWC